MVFVHISWFTALKTLGISCDKSNKCVFCYDNEVTFGRSFGNLGMGPGCQGNQPGD